MKKLIKESFSHDSTINSDSPATASREQLKNLTLAGSVDNAGWNDGCDCCSTCSARHDDETDDMEYELTLDPYVGDPNTGITSRYLQR